MKDLLSLPSTMGKEISTPVLRYMLNTQAICEALESMDSPSRSALRCVNVRNSVVQTGVSSVS